MRLWRATRTESEANAKEAELRTRESKGFWSQHWNCQSKHFLKVEREVQNVLVT